MYIGEQYHGSRINDRRVTLGAQLGVEHAVVDVRIGPPAAGNPVEVSSLYDDRGLWSTASLRALIDYFLRFGIKIDALHLDLGTLHRDLTTNPTAPDIHAVFDRARSNIQSAGDVGIPCLKYNLQVSGIFRTGRRTIRGGALGTEFVIDAATTENLLRHSFGTSEADVRSTSPIEPEDSWRAIETIVGEILPTAEAAGIDLACHPQDPALPSSGVLGIPHVLASFDGLRRFLSLSSSPRHRLNFCQGTVSEMCQDPATEVLAAIAEFGSRADMVHFRNIKGRALDFAETLPDDGDVDMLAALMAWRNVGFEGIFVPDHVPDSDVDEENDSHFAFALGYTRGLIQAVMSGTRTLEDADRRS